MWDDVVIGSGDKGCSAIKVFGIGDENNVSQNSVSYWVSNCYLGMGMTIFKNTEEGRKLAQMIDEKRGSGAIQSWLQGVLLSNVTKAKLKSAVTKALADAFENGRANKAAEVRAVLGV
jgi:hypothetical protein